MKDTTKINSADYWNTRFANDWESCDGPRQSRFFARLAVEHLPRWLLAEIKRQALTLVDWGCGQGDGTDVWASYIGSEQLTGVDFSSIAIEQATQRYPAVRFINEDWLAGVSEASEVFDVVFSSNTLEHFYKPYDVLRTLCRRARKAVVLVLPYRELERIEEHLFSFLPENLPLVLSNGFRLAWSQVMDCRQLPDSFWDGYQIFLVYAEPGWLDNLDLTLSDCCIDQNDSNAQMKRLNTSLAERDGQVANLTQAVAERDGQVGSLNQLVFAGNEEITDLKKEVAERDGQIASLNQAVAERDGQIASLNQAVAERDGQIASLASSLERNLQLEQSLAAAQAAHQGTEQELVSLKVVHAQILNSRSWRLTRSLRVTARILRGQLSISTALYELLKAIYWHLPEPLRHQLNALRHKFVAWAYRRRSLVADTNRPSAPDSFTRLKMGTGVEAWNVGVRLADARDQAIELSHVPRGRHVGMLVAGLNAGDLERVVLDLSRGLRDRGHKITILTTGLVGQIAEEARTLGLEVLELKGGVHELERFAGSSPLDILFTHHCYLGLDALAHRGVPVVEVLHNAYYWQRDNLELHALRAAAVQSYVAVSSFVRDFAVSQLEIPVDRVEVIKNALSPSGFIRPGPQFMLRLRRRNAAHFTFLHAANFHSTKCHRTVVSAFSRVTRDNRLARLLMVGEPLIPELATSVAKRVDSLGLSDRISLTGPLNRRELSYVMSTSHAALLPSSVEGFSVTSLEYLYFGLPVITTDTGGARDVFCDKDVGLVIPGPIPDLRHISLASVEQAAWAEDAGHASALADAMIQFMSDRQQWLDKIEIIEDRAAKFNIEKTVDQYNQFLLRLTR